jgi:hypothetical protein
MRASITRWLLVSAVFVVTATAFGPPSTSAKQSNKVRAFYLAGPEVQGSAALNACAAGFHMASLWEIHSVGSLRYETALGLQTDDSGFGPPTTAGWVRTGSFAFAQTAGAANCHAWTSTNTADFGTTVGLVFVWAPTNTTTSTVLPWLAQAVSCADRRPVWCVED